MAHEAGQTVAGVAAYAQHRHDEEMEKLTESAKEEQHAMEIAMIQRERAFANEAAIAAERQIADFETATQDRNSKSEASLVQQMNRMMEEERSVMGRVLQAEVLNMRKAYDDELARRTDEMNGRFAALELTAVRAEAQRAQAERVLSAMVESERAKNEQAAAAMDVEWQRIEKQVVYHTPEAAQRYDLSPKGGGDVTGNFPVPIHAPFTFSVDAAPSGANPRKVENGVTPGAPCVSAAGDRPANTGAPKPSTVTAAGTTTRTQSKTAAASSSGEKQPIKRPLSPMVMTKANGPKGTRLTKRARRETMAGVTLRTRPSLAMAMTMGIIATKTQRMCSGERIAF
jgi:hypothetical protein